MKRNVFFFTALTCAANLYAVEPVDTAKAVMLQDVQVTSTRAGKHTPMAFSNQMVCHRVMLKAHSSSG